MSDNNNSQPRLIRKYANRRMYDTHTSTHVNVNDIRQLVIDEIPFQVVDAKSGEDLTRSILLQIIQEAENDGEPIFSSDMLKGIIRFYGPLQGMLGSYLEQSIQTVVDLQTKATAQTSQAWSDFIHKQSPVTGDLMKDYMEQSKKLYQSTQSLFGLFGAPSPAKSEDAKTKKDDEAT
ncbi:polyhydroxyalkanoate synthesis repressor PhaR [Pseudomonas sp. C27(2019)]|uniref:polyhydroxyalkanoate synthesis repressor PhaR n=1 Tax=Pseudomonas sp. C27(2019) TaxID=2604941 RepID=UPI0012457335|nr:polyhydroxyalkanoate synthesis repressor PhaR [Pseudomonas sp. C27(2019)]QEY59229.1 polyhydroxyalkanoate synthesis repressor PhaR [Pseudomonas sp. C27(2019)]